MYHMEEDLKTEIELNLDLTLGGIFFAIAGYLLFFSTEIFVILNSIAYFAAAIVFRGRFKSNTIKFSEPKR
jgi:hypothetical protein